MRKSLMIYSYLLSTVLLIFVSCKETNTTAAEVQSKQVVNSNLSDNYVSSLYEYYVNAPSLQAHIDENLIIDYIVAGDLEYIRTQSGLYYSLLEKGEGANYQYGQDCSTDYSGYFLDGRVFDSSYSRNRRLDFKVGQMNKGWNEVLQLVNPGTKLKVILPSRLAYGERGFTGYVPPNSVIAFDIICYK